MYLVKRHDLVLITYNKYIKFTTCGKTINVMAVVIIKQKCFFYVFNIAKTNKITIAQVSTV